MPFTEEQSEEIKKQILKQVENLDVKNKEQIIEKLKILTASSLKNF